jgi:hypothetical protein
MIPASISHLSHSTLKNTYILCTNSRAIAVNGGHASLHRAQWFGTCYRMGSFATDRHVMGFVAAAVLLLLLVLPDSDRAEHDSDSPQQLELEPGSDPERHSMSLSKFSQFFTQFVCCNCYERGTNKINCTFFSTRGAAALHIVRREYQISTKYLI